MSKKAILKGSCRKDWLEIQFKNIEWSTGSSGSWQAVPQPRSGVPEGTVSSSGIACDGHSQEMLSGGEYKLWRNKVVKMIHMLYPSWGMPTTMFPFVVVSPCALPYVRTWLPPSADRTFLSPSTYLGTIFHSRWKMLNRLPKWIARLARNIQIIGQKTAAVHRGKARDLGTKDKASSKVNQPTSKQ